MTDDGRFLIITVERGCDPYNKLYYYDLKKAGYKVRDTVEVGR